MRNARFLRAFFVRHGRTFGAQAALGLVAFKQGGIGRFWKLGKDAMKMTNKNMVIGKGGADEVWDRFPSRGYYYGLSRPYWYQQIRAGTIKTALIRQPGRVRGIRLVWRPSVLAFIEQYAVKAG